MLQGDLEGFYLLPKSKSILTFSHSRKERNADEKKEKLSNSDDFFTANYFNNQDIKFWGSTNFKPQEVLETIVNNAITPGLLNFKSMVARAKGLTFYIEEIDGSKKIKKPIIDSDLDSWLEDIDISNFLKASVWDATILSNTFSEVILNRAVNRVVTLKRIDASNCRIEQNKKNCYIYKSWDFIGSNNSEHYFKLPIYKAGVSYPHFIIHSQNHFTGSSHYGFAPWWGSLSWLKFANEIPLFKYSSIVNGFSIKYHIEIPMNYFELRYPANRKNPKTGQYYTDKDRYEAAIKLREDMDKFLAGSENSHKTFITYFALDYEGKPVQGWKITPLEDNTKYEAYIDDFNTSNQAVTSAHNIDPSIASINTQGSLSSGSDKRNAFNIMSEISVLDVRELILEPIRIAKNISFPEKKNIKIAFENVELTTTDLVKSGTIDNKIV